MDRSVDDELAHLVATWTPARVEVEGHGFFEVRSPTVREALSVYALLPPSASGSVDDEVALRRIVHQWLPLRLATALFTRKQSWPTRSRLLLSLLTAALPDVAAAQQQRAELEEKARTRSWSSVLAEYASVYHADPLREPWAYFLERCSVLDEVRARDEVSFMTGYGAAKSGKPDPVFVRAGMKDAPEDVEEPEFMRDPDWKEAQLEKIRALRQKQGRC